MTTKHVDRIIAGALYDFAARLTTRETIVLGSAHHPEPVLNALKEWANDRNISLDDAAVEHWTTIRAEDVTHQRLHDAIVYGLRKWEGDDKLFLPTGKVMSAVNAVWDVLHPPPRHRYAPPVTLSDGSTFGQTGPDQFTLFRAGGQHSTGNAAWWRGATMWNPGDGKLVLSVLDGAERAR